MGDICKPDFLIERTYQHDGPEFVLEAFENRNPEPGDIALKEAFSQFKERLLTKIGPLHSRQDLLNDFIFDKSKKKLPLPVAAFPNQRAGAIKWLLDNKETKLRFIISQWSQPFPDNFFRSKMTPNGNKLWGATLFDFLFVERSYNPGWRAISTASRLAKWAKATGKTNIWAEAEKDPEVIEPYDIQVVIQEWEESMRQHIIASQMDEEDQGEEGLQSDRWALPEQWPPKSAFEPEAYPKGWSTEPFSDDRSYGPSVTPVLQHYIPQHRLPQKLVVHDVSNSLNEPRIYKLKPSKTFDERRKADEKEEAAKQVHAEKVLQSFLANPHSSLEHPNGLELIDLKEPGWTKPPVFVVFPFRPPLSRPEEAHLYLSRKYLLGRGSHSCVFDAEMVVPRSWLVHEVICIECVKEDVKELLEEEDGPQGERRLKKWDEKTGMVVLQELGNGPAYTHMTWDDIGTVRYVIQGAGELAYKGPYRVINTRIEYQNLERGPLCVHLSKGKAHCHPLATKVRLAAKVSIENWRDLEMLQSEAYNYQRFPKHFFEHWSGYNVWFPMRDPVPVGALVPQFYGFYYPEDKTVPYKSPILLVEQCGKQIAADELSVDDRNECLSLGFRMNAADWLHGSFWERNIMKQPGPLNKSPLCRSENEKHRNGYGVDWSFRLIDFGRSCHLEDFLEEGPESYTKLIDERKKLQRWWQSRSRNWK